MSISGVSSNQYGFGMTGVSQVKQDFQSLQNSLTSGDLAGAQKAFAAVQQDVKKAHGGHHLHKGGSDATTSPSQSSGTLVI